MKKKLTTIPVCLLIISLPLFADGSDNNPFKHLGYEMKIATLTDNNEEFHDQEDVVEIGQVLFDTRKKEIVGFVGEKDHRIELKTDVISTSIDPHCEKYPWITPYAYCLNNPVRFVDPDGRDVWEINNKGEIEWKEEGGDHRLYTVNKDGKRGEQYITVKDRNILDQLTMDRDGYKGSYAITKRSEAGDIFTFASNNSAVEWAMARFKNGEYVITTSHHPTKVENVVSIEGYNEQDLVFKVHSHPGADSPKGASESSALRSDMRNIKEMAVRFEKAGNYANFPKHFVYHPDSRNLYQYTPYTPSINLGSVNKTTSLLKRIQESKSSFYGY